LDLIGVAGERVLYDSLAAPFSMGLNLLCIYSKKHIDTPPEKKHEKQLHNKRTMSIMGGLLSKGGKCIYVAPSGGRDRPDENGKLTVDQFDAQSIEMFYLMSKRAKKTTHFYPLALATYNLMPPPKEIGGEIGEKRITHYTPVFMKVGKEIDMANVPGLDPSDKRLSRKVRGKYIHDTVCRDYNTLA
ncbi:MAG: glycerol-3-phosphate acyltransferase, partial [Simkaniaceae bacterium]|nr:glycerol-3-phosphate acyltransferase [Simkaniaceae bacterium]